MFEKKLSDYKMRKKTTTTRNKIRHNCRLLNTMLIKHSKQIKLKALVNDLYQWACNWPSIPNYKNEQSLKNKIKNINLNMSGLSA